MSLAFSVCEGGAGPAAACVQADMMINWHQLSSLSVGLAGKAVVPLCRVGQTLGSWPFPAIAM